MFLHLSNAYWQPQFSFDEDNKEYTVSHWWMVFGWVSGADLRDNKPFLLVMLLALELKLHLVKGKLLPDNICSASKTLSVH